MKKKKGSSLIFVLITFAVVTIVGLSVLSLTLISYKKRFVEANEKRNQYFSESGIDIAYGIIGKTVDKAVEEGNNAVNTELENINKASRNGLTPIEENEKYKKYLKSDGTLNKEAIDKAMSELFWEKYKKHIEENLVENIVDRSLYNVGEEKKYDIPIVMVTDKDGKVLPGEEENAKGVKLSFVDDGDKDDNTLSVHLQSEFSSNKTSAEAVNSGQIHKKISVTYIIGPSKYGKPITQKVENVKVPMTEVWKKAICTDGNLSVKGNVNVKGDIYAKGRDNGGIEITGGSSNINGIIATSGSFNVNALDNINFTVNGNVYAENLSLNSLGTNINSPGKPLSFTVLPGSKSGGELLGAIYTNNDLEISGSNIAVATKYFYGINDRTEDNEEIIKNGTKPKASSSILINPDESGNKASVDISDKAIFMGVAYIQTSPQYQTGESVSIKENYKAYMQSLKDGKFQEGNVIFQYYSPLVLAAALKDESGNEKSMDSNDKSNYIQEYIKEFKSDFEKWKEKVSIILPDDKNILSIGTYADNDKIGGNNYGTENHEAFLRVKKAKYSRVVYSMKSECDKSEDDDFNKNYTEEELKKRTDEYDNYESNNLIVIDTSKNKTVSNQIPFDSIKQPVNKTVTHKSADNYSGKKDVIYLNGNENDKVYIIGDGGGAPAGIDSIDTRIVQGGVIITKGEVHLSGNINFTGTIIAGKDIICENMSNGTITYNEEYVKEVIGVNGDLFSQIAVKGSDIKDSFEYTSVTDYGAQQNNVGTDVIRNAELIKIKNWRILQ